MGLSGAVPSIQFFLHICRPPSSILQAFSELRAMADEGSITYPYSTREVVNIVKHLQVQASRRDIGIIVLIFPHTEVP